ncbi:MAG TPA: hypothetical protein VIH43_03600 [Chthoniobacterales bacterium]
MARPGHNGDKRQPRDLGIASSAYPTEGRLAVAIARGEERAIYELFNLYAPLLRHQAAILGIAPGDRSELVDTLLDDVVMHFVNAPTPPRHLVTYLTSALRNRVRTRHRDDSRRRAVDERAYSESAESTEQIVAECHSEYGLRSALSLENTAHPTLRSAIANLASRSAAALSKDELTMVVAIGQDIPLRMIALELGWTYGAARVRLSRLRERFVRLAAEYTLTLESNERREIARFFRRADVRITAADKVDVMTPRQKKAAVEPEDTL